MNILVSSLLMEIIWILNENLRSHKNLYMNVYSNSIRNHQLCKQPKCSSLSKGINRLWYVHATEYYAVVKRSNNSEASPRHCTEWKQPFQRDFVQYDLIHVTFFKRVHYREGDQSSGCQGSGMGEGRVWCEVGGRFWGDVPLLWWRPRETTCVLKFTDVYTRNHPILLYINL